MIEIIRRGENFEASETKERNYSYKLLAAPVFIEKTRVSSKVNRPILPDDI